MDKYNVAFSPPHITDEYINMEGSTCMQYSVPNAELRTCILPTTGCFFPATFFPAVARTLPARGELSAASVIAGEEAACVYVRLCVQGMHAERGRGTHDAWRSAAWSDDRRGLVLGGYVASKDNQ